VLRCPEVQRDILEHIDPDRTHADNETRGEQ
jgi:hypothetical protein